MKLLVLAKHTCSINFDHKALLVLSFFKLVLLLQSSVIKKEPVAWWRNKSLKQNYEEPLLIIRLIRRIKIDKYLEQKL